MSPTAYRRSVWVGCCSSPRCRLHDTTWSESSSTPITKPSLEPSTAYQPGKRLSRVHEAGSRTGSIRVAVEKLDAPPEQRPRRPVRNRAELRLGSGNVEPAQRHHDDVGRERRELLPGTGDRKSTRLNSSHRCISYAVFCLKKKRTKTKDSALH